MPRVKLDLSPETKASILSLYAAGKPYAFIRKKLGVTDAGILRVIQLALQDGTLKRRKIRGSVRKALGLPQKTRSLRQQALEIVRAEMLVMSPLGKAALKTLISEI